MGKCQIGTLFVENLTLTRCKEHLASLISVSSDVSDWEEGNFLFDLPDKWNLSFSVWLDEIVGYCIMSRKWPDRIHIHQFMVAQELRGNNIGVAMMNVAIERVGKQPLTLKVAKNNEGAIKFYEREGFEIGTQEKEYLWMTRTV